MIQAHKVYTRPNTSVLWHDEVIDSSALQKYTENGTRVSNYKTFSEDFLVCTYYAVWISEEALLTYDSDPEIELYWQERDDYNALVGITSTPRVITVIE